MLVEVRTASVDDIEAIDAIQQQGGYNHWSTQLLQQSLENNSVWLLEAEGTVQAFAIFQNLLDETELLNIVVSPQQQGRGLGRKLLSHCLSTLQIQGINSCLLEVGRNNVNALALYHKLGFEQVGERKNYYQTKDGREDALLLKLDLTSNS